jgi:hypothetical protein
MWIKWFPWKFVLKQVALAQGFVDPIMLLSRFNRFAQPSEVWAPVELMRAGAVLHARGLINSQVIQHNLDWVWPYWVERQFDPADPSFIPRAFSLTHINLTHRNWTAVALPSYHEMPVVDPRGLVMPFFDSWSIDSWLITQTGKRLLPSRLPERDVSQRVDYKDGWAVHNDFKLDGLSISSKVDVQLRDGIPVCRIRLSGKSDVKSWLTVVLRPYNPEGISFIHKIRMFPSGEGWDVDEKKAIFFDKPDRYHFSDYSKGDVYHWVLSSCKSDDHSVICDVGMASSMAAYEINPGSERNVNIEIPLQDLTKKSVFSPKISSEKVWKENLKKMTDIEFPYGRFEELYKIALRTLVLHSPDECYAGPYTYKRFWFRDAAFIIHALLCAGMQNRAGRIIDTFFDRQTGYGYFLSQDGEWDSNGEALWAMQQYCLFSGTQPPVKWKQAVENAAGWIVKKRTSVEDTGVTAGLFPAGFSAEHLGPNDFYYWDNFWGIAGLRAAAWMFGIWDGTGAVNELRRQESSFVEAVERSLEKIAGPMRRRIMPASPNRRPDSGAVGSLSAGYPLKIFGPKDPRLLLTAQYLFENNLIDNAFYHDISHSGINPYLTLHIAQVFLRGADPRFRPLMEAIASLASPTGQWPEAIHPSLKTGCMGDGQHVWAAAEWTLIMRNCFLREEEPDTLVLCAGMCREFLNSVDRVSFGPAPTIFGPVIIELRKKDKVLILKWNGEWFKEAPNIRIEFPGKEPVIIEKGKDTLEFPLEESR